MKVARSLKETRKSNDLNSKSQLKEIVSTETISSRFTIENLLSIANLLPQKQWYRSNKLSLYKLRHQLAFLIVIQYCNGRVIYLALLFRVTLKLMLQMDETIFVFG